jgi:tripartite-type tricarboxylate transporter receptor subunit TctC
MIVGFAAGGPNDILARLIAQGLSERLGQQFVIENRTGAGGNIGTEAVVNSSPDDIRAVTSKLCSRSRQS